MDKEITDLTRLISDEFGMSRSETRRVIAQGAVRIDGEEVTDIDAEVDDDVTIQVGRNRKMKVEYDE